MAAAIAEVGAELGVPGMAWRREPAGVWVDDKKIAACGIHVARGVPVHGFALDVATPPEAWTKIVPCGIGVPQTSLARQLGRAVAVAVVDVAALLGPRLEARL